MLTPLLGIDGELSGVEGEEPDEMKGSEGILERSDWLCFYMEVASNDDHGRSAARRSCQKNAGDRPICVQGARTIAGA